MNGQLTLVQDALKRDKPIETVYNEALGWCCPVCGGISRMKNIKYCPGCGQRLKFISVEENRKKVFKLSESEV